MKFRLKTLFLITLLVAMLVGSVSVSIRTSAEVRRLKEIVDSSLVELDAEQSLHVNKSQHRNDFGLFTSGNIGWDVAIDDQSGAKIQLIWQSRLWFAKRLSISLIHGGKTKENRFAEEFIRVFQKHRPDVVVNEIEG